LLVDCDLACLNEAAKNPAKTRAQKFTTTCCNPMARLLRQFSLCCLPSPSCASPSRAPGSAREREAGGECWDESKWRRGCAGGCTRQSPGEKGRGGGTSRGEERDALAVAPGRAPEREGWEEWWERGAARLHSSTDGLQQHSLFRKGQLDMPSIDQNSREQRATCMNSHASWSTCFAFQPRLPNLWHVSGHQRIRWLAPRSSIQWVRQHVGGRADEVCIKTSGAAPVTQHVLRLQPAQPTAPSFSSRVLHPAGRAGLLRASVEQLPARDGPLTGR